MAVVAEPVSARVALGADGAHLVQADNYAAIGRCGVERLDAPLFSANSGSTRSPNQVSCRRQRRPSRSRISSIRLRRMAMPLCSQQVGGEPVQGPRRERQTQAARAGQRGGDHRRDLVGRVGRRAPRAVVVLKGRKPFGVEPADAATHGLGTQPKRLGNGGRRLTLAGTPDDAGALDPTRRCRPRAGQALHRRSLLSGQLAQANRRATHGTSPDQGKPPSYSNTCRTNH